jgi:hypothetical protein
LTASQAPKARSKLRPKISGRQLVPVENTSFLVDPDKHMLYWVDTDVYGRKGQGLGAIHPVENAYWDPDRSRFELSSDEKQVWISNLYPDHKYYMNVSKW